MNEPNILQKLFQLSAELIVIERLFVDNIPFAGLWIGPAFMLTI